MRKLFLGQQNKLPRDVADRRDPQRNVHEKLIQHIDERLHPFPPPFTHHIRVGSYASQLAAALAPALDFTKPQIREIVAAAVTHDIGKTHEDTQHFYETHYLKYGRKFLDDLNKIHQEKGYEMLGDLELGEFAPFRHSMQTAAGWHHFPTRDVQGMRFPTETCVWALHITRVVDGFDAGTVGEAERAYGEQQTQDQIASGLWFGAKIGHYELLVVETWIRDCLHKNPDRLPSPNKKQKEILGLP